MSDPAMIAGDSGGRHDPGDGEVPDRPLRRGADPAGARDRLHRRVRGADSGRHRPPRRQVAVRDPVRLRRDEPRRGAAPHRRGRGDDPDEGRGRNRRRRQRGHAHARRLRRHPAARSLREEELYAEAKELRAPYELVRWVAENGRLPVVTFTAGGIATPADAALCMQLGADGVFVGSGIFKSGDPALRAKAIVEATTHYRDAEILAVSPPGSASRWSASRPPRSARASCSKPAAGKPLRARARRGTVLPRRTTVRRNRPGGGTSCTSSVACGTGGWRSRRSRSSRSRAASPTRRSPTRAPASTTPAC